MKCIAASILLAVLSTGAALAQTSASYKLQEYTFNNGGDPWSGSFAASASHRIRLDAIGDAVAMTGLSSASHRMDNGFVGDYPPPGEVHNNRWTDKTTLIWDPEKSIGSYDVYRDTISALPGTFGACFQSPLPNESAVDATNPAVGTGWFYLVTAKNLLGEEGTKGFRSSGVERPNTAPCP
jgi:hypothetical protein